MTGDTAAAFGAVLKYYRDGVAFYRRANRVAADPRVRLVFERLARHPRVEVILLSRNSSDTGLRIFNSIQHHNLNISKAAFCGGSSPYRYITAFNCHLFLSTNGQDVRQALEHGVKVSGCTVHLVDEQLDGGPIVVQRAVPVEDDDTVDTLSARILEQEHRAYVEALRIVLSGKYRIDGRRVRRDG